MTIFWRRSTPAWVLLVAILTLGQIRLDRPRSPRLPRIGHVHRLWLSREARRRGKKDGKLGIPASDERAAPPEIQKLKQQADGVLRRIAAKWSDGDARLKGEYYAILREFASEKEASAALLADLEALRAKCAQQRANLDAQRAEDSLRSADERWRLGKYAYATGIFFIFVGEFPLNAVAFRLFQENLPATYSMTAGLAATLVLCAHALGVFLRMKPSTSRSEFLSWLLGTFPILVIVAVGIIREVYINDIGRLNHTGGGLATLGPIAGTAVFVVINLLIYLGAGVLSYLHHDPEGQLLDKAEKRARRTERRVKRLRATIERRAIHLRWLQTKKEIWKAAGEGALREATYVALQHKDFYESFMQLYWSSNRLAVEKIYRRRMRRWNKRRAKAERRSQPIPPEPKAWKPAKAMTAAADIRIPHEFDNTRPDQRRWQAEEHVEDVAVRELTTALDSYGQEK